MTAKLSKYLLPFTFEKQGMQAQQVSLSSFDIFMTYGPVIVPALRIKVS